MFAVTGVSDVNGRQLAVHAVAVVLAFGNAAGDAAVDVAHAFSSFRKTVSAILAKISETALTNCKKTCKIKTDNRKGKGDRYESNSQSRCKRQRKKRRYH